MKPSTLPNYPSPEVHQFGDRVAVALSTASIRRSMGGLGGCPLFDLDDFDADMHPYVEAYAKGDHDSTAIMYAAMKTKEQEILGDLK